MPENRHASPWDEVSIEHHLERMQTEYAITANPLYIWDALNVLLNHRRPDEARAAPLPDWIIEYLARASSFIMLLTCGWDYKAVEKAEREGKNLAAAIVDIMGKTSPAQATKRVGEALGFEKRGRNVFVQYKARNEMVDDFIEYGDMLEEGVKSRDAISEIMESRKIEDERTVRRRLAAARAIFPPYDKPAKRKRTAQ
jgi:hypothetical protein